MKTRKDSILGLPNGSLFEPTAKLMAKIGIKVDTSSRSFEQPINGLGLFNKILIMRPQAIPTAISRGILKAGICGWDWVVENGLEGSLWKITELNYGKKSQKAVRIVAFGRNEEWRDGEGAKIYSEYPALTKRFFPGAQIHFSPGSTEIMVCAGAYDFGVSVVETGKTLKDNNLKILKVLLISPVVLMAKERTPELEIFGEILKGGLISENYQLLKFNVDAENLPGILSFLPALEAPTINQLADGSLSVESVIKKRELVQTLIKVRKKGGKGILLQDINIVLQ